MSNLSRAPTVKGAMAHKILPSCTRCGACLPECPNEAIVDGVKQFFIDADFCGDHMNCVKVCPVAAIVPMTVTEKEKPSAPRTKGPASRAGH